MMVFDPRQIIEIFPIYFPVVTDFVQFLPKIWICIRVNTFLGRSGKIFAIYLRKSKNFDLFQELFLEISLIYFLIY